MYVQLPSKMLNPNPDHRNRAIAAWFVCVGVRGGPCDAADEEGFWLDGLEEDVYVESRQAGFHVDLGDCICQGGFVACGGEGVRWVVDVPERHCYGGGDGGVWRWRLGLDKGCCRLKQPCLTFLL